MIVDQEVAYAAELSGVYGRRVSKGRDGCVYCGEHFILASGRHLDVGRHEQLRAVDGVYAGVDGGMRAHRVGETAVFAQVGEQLCAQELAESIGGDEIVEVVGGVAAAEGVDDTLGILHLAREVDCEIGGSEAVVHVYSLFAAAVAGQ